MVKNTEPIILKTADHIRTDYPRYIVDGMNNVIIIYGEIFGGIYNGVSNSKVVQTGVQYTPNIMFYAFDIKINGKFIPYHNFQKICESTGLMYSKPLHKGQLDDLLKLDPTFQSTIPTQLGLDLIPNNTAEGYVIKPINQTINSRGGRIIWKLKSPKFRETRPKPVPQIGGDIQDIFEELFPMICRNRLDNILSHGPDIPTGKEMQFLIGNLIKDAIVESSYNLPVKTRKKLVKLLNPEATKIVNNYLSSLSDINLPVLKLFQD